MRKTMLLQRISWIEESVKDILKVTNPVFEGIEGYDKSAGEIFESIAEMRAEIGKGSGVYRIIDKFCPDGLEGFAVNEEGMNLEFDTYHDAFEYAEKNLQKDFYEIVEM